MKKIRIVLVVLLMVLRIGMVNAHEHHQNSVKMTVTEKRADSLMQIQMAEHQQMEAVEAFPNYHPLIVHFPIVLLLMALVFQLLSFVYFKKEFGWTTLILLTLGVITAWLASNTFHAEPGLLRGKAAVIFAAHERMATFTWWFAVAALLTKVLSHFFLQRKWWIESLVALLLVGSGIFVSITGHHGAQLVYMQGIGPEGRYLESYRLQQKASDSLSGKTTLTKPEAENIAGTPEAQEEEHPVGEIGKGPHGGTIEEAEPYHIEIVVAGTNLVFYLLDGNTRPVDMKMVTGNLKMRYENKSVRTFELMEMGGKYTAMGANNGKAVTAVCTITKNDKSYTASFDIKKDMPAQK